VDIVDDSPIFSFDFLLMQQVVSNILHNAAVYTPRGTPIEIRGMKEKNTYKLEFRDHGPGVPVDPPSRVFEKFWRGDPLKPGGTGLGLAIAKGWVEAHGGTIEVLNHPDGGALFTIHLPLDT
jgi:two-component system sensor histidine kinase KdpD